MNDIVNSTQIENILDGIDYPVSKRELIEFAKDNGADENVVKTLEKFPDQMYDSMAEVSKVIQNLEE